MRQLFGLHGFRTDLADGHAARSDNRLGDRTLAGNLDRKRLEYAQQRGTLIVNPGDKVYEGMVVGYSPAGEDITVNVCKTKHLTNTRASGSDDALRLVPVSKFSLEESLEFLKPDELLEVTPQSIRMRKRILSHDLRMKALKGGKNV